MIGTPGILRRAEKGVALMAFVLSPMENAIKSFGINVDLTAGQGGAVDTRHRRAARQNVQG